MAMSPASPDSSVTSGASICQEDNIFMPPCATIPEMGGGNDENDLDRIDEATVAPSVEEIVPTLRISTSDGLAYALQSPALQTEANSCSGPFSGASHSLDHTLDHTLDQGIGVKRKCVTNSNSNRMEGFTTSSFSGIHMQMPQALMSNPRFYGNMGNIQNSNMNNMNRSQATAHDPHRLPSYSDHTGSSPSYMNQYNSGPVFPPQVGYEPMSGPPSVNTQMGNMQLQHDIVGNPQVGNPQVCSSSHSNSTQMVSSNSQAHMSNPQMSGPSFADPQMTNTQLSNTLMSSQQVSSPTYVNNPLLGKNQHLNNPQMGGQQMGSSQMGSSQMGSSQMGSQQMGNQQMGSQQMGSPQMSSPQPLSSPVLGNLLLGGQQGSHMSPFGNNKTDDALFSTQQALLAQKQAAVSSTTDNVSPHM